MQKVQLTSMLGCLDVGTASMSSILALPDTLKTCEASYEVEAAGLLKIQAEMHP